MEMTVMWCGSAKGMFFGPAKELNMMLLLDRDQIVEVIHSKVRDFGDHACR
jgi:hypothetical protein